MKKDFPRGRKVFLLTNPDLNKQDMLFEDLRYVEDDDLDLKQEYNDEDAILEFVIENLCPPVETLKQLEDFLLERNSSSDNPIELFIKDASVIRFQNDLKSKFILSAIKQKNETKGMGTLKIKGSKIELINFTFCPKCKKAFSFKELKNEYLRPRTIIDKTRQSKASQNARVHCLNCKTWFLPALIISDGTPTQQIEFLCRSQTIDAIELYMAKKGKSVLRKNNVNKMTNNDGLKAIANDLDYEDLLEYPTLLVNLMQYTPFNLVMSFLQRKNLQTREPLCGVWYP
ncbi:MAG: hypothetical protein QNL04_10375 [SAR324 cluster bacterium]|nr:hypothetical protein [SAR324 cluster bacterium]